MVMNKIKKISMYIKNFMFWKIKITSFKIMKIPIIYLFEIGKIIKVNLKD